MKTNHSRVGDAGVEHAYKGPRSPARVMKIIEALAEAQANLSLAILAKQLSIPKTSLLHHLRALVATGHVELRNTRYVLGPASERLGTIIAARSTVQRSIEPIARKLAQDGGETSLIAVLDEVQHEAVYIGVFEGTHPVRYLPTVGTRRPLYSAAVGRALLAFKGETYIKSYLRTTIRRHITAATVTDRERLSQILAKVRTAGHAVTDSTHLDGVGGIASPVFDRSGQIRYAIGVGVPTTRLRAEAERLTRLVQDAARMASWALGAHEGEPPPAA